MLGWGFGYVQKPLVLEQGISQSHASPGPGEEATNADVAGLLPAASIFSVFPLKKHPRQGTALPSPDGPYVQALLSAQVHTKGHEVEQCNPSPAVKSVLSIGSRAGDCPSWAMVKENRSVCCPSGVVRAAAAVTL